MVAGIVLPASTSLLTQEDARRTLEYLYDNSIFKYAPSRSQTTTPRTTTTSTTETSRQRYFVPLFDELAAIVAEKMNEKRSIKIPKSFTVYEAVPRNHKS